MSYTFTEFGAAFDTTIGEFARQASVTVAASVARPVELALAVWILVMGFLYMNGLTKMTFREIVFQVCKVSLISMVALQTPTYVAYMIDMLGQLDSYFISMLPHTAGAPAPTNVWDSVSILWSGSWDLVTRMMNLKVGFSLTAFFESMVIIILACLVGIGVIFMTSMGLSLIVVNKVILVIMLGFGPLFLCFLMFNLTRGLFSGWLRTIMSVICTFVLFAAAVVFAMVAIDPIVGELEALSVESEDGLIPSLLELAGLFLVICFSFASLFRWIPMVSRNITGAIAGGPGMGMLATGAAVTAAGFGGAALGAGAAALAAKGVSQAGSAATGAWGLASAMAEGNRGMRAAMAANMGPTTAGGSQSGLNSFLGGMDAPLSPSGGSTPPSSGPGGAGAAAEPVISGAGGSTTAAGASLSEGGGTAGFAASDAGFTQAGAANGELPQMRETSPYGVHAGTTSANSEVYHAESSAPAGLSNVQSFTAPGLDESTSNFTRESVSMTDAGERVVAASNTLSATGGSVYQGGPTLTSIGGSSSNYVDVDQTTESSLSQSDAAAAMSAVAAANARDAAFDYRNAMESRQSPTLSTAGSANDSYRAGLVDRGQQALREQGQTMAYAKGAVADTIHRTNAAASSVAQQARDVKSAAWNRFAQMSPNAARFAQSYGAAQAERVAQQAQAYEKAVQSGQTAAGYAPSSVAGSLKTMQGTLERAAAAAKGRTVAGAGSGFMMGYALGADRSEYGDFEDDGGDGD